MFVRSGCLSPPVVPPGVGGRDLVTLSSFGIEDAIIRVYRMTEVISDHRTTCSANLMSRNYLISIAIYIIYDISIIQ